jgi:type I restriction enzyme S subunit
MMEIIKFRWLAKEVDRRNSADIDFPLMSVSQTKGVVPRSELMGNEGRAESLENYKVCTPGQIVINRMSASSGALGVARQGGLVSPDYAVIEPTDLVTSEYLEFVMRSDWFIGEMVARLKGIGAGGESASVRTPRINISDLGDLDIRIPPKDKQIEITQFLKKEIDRIDAAIKLRRQQIDLINLELVPSILDCAFSRLSGKSMNLSWLLEKKVHDGPHTTPEFTRSGVPFLSVDSISNFSINWENVRFISEVENSEFSRKSRPEYGDILLTKSASIGKVAVVETKHIFNVWSPIAILRVKTELVNNFFVAWQLLSPSLQSQMMNACTHSTQNNLAMKDIEKLKIIVPTLQEQITLVGELEIELRLIDAQVESLTQIVHLLSEYRNSLLTSIITGHFDLDSGRSVA